MSGPAPGDTGALIGRLTAELRPVRRLGQPVWRAAAWFAVVLLGAVLLAGRADMTAVGARIMARPDLWWSVVGSVGTALTAGLAALMLAIPDRDGRWAWLPLPSAAVWLGASGLGCLRDDTISVLHPASMAEAGSRCLPFILTTSELLAVPLGILLWRARPLRLGAVAWTGGLAVAAASASLLWLCHPFDTSLADVLVHAGAVGLVMLGCRAVSLIVPE